MTREVQHLRCGRVSRTAIHPRRGAHRRRRRAAHTVHHIDSRPTPPLAGPRSGCRDHAAALRPKAPHHDLDDEAGMRPTSMSSTGSRPNEDDPPRCGPGRRRRSSPPQAFHPRFAGLGDLDLEAVDAEPERTIIRPDPADQGVDQALASPRRRLRKHPADSLPRDPEPDLAAVGFEFRPEPETAVRLPGWGRRGVRVLAPPGQFSRLPPMTISSSPPLIAGLFHDDGNVVERVGRLRPTATVPLARRPRESTLARKAAERGNARAGFAMTPP